MSNSIRVVKAANVHSPQHLQSIVLDWTDGQTPLSLIVYTGIVNLHFGTTDDPSRLDVLCPVIGLVNHFGAPVRAILPVVEPSFRGAVATASLASVGSRSPNGIGIAAVDEVEANLHSVTLEPSGRQVHTVVLRADVGSQFSWVYRIAYQVSVLVRRADTPDPIILDNTTWNGNYVDIGQASIRGVPQS